MKPRHAGAARTVMKVAPDGIPTLQLLDGVGKAKSELASKGLFEISSEHLLPSPSSPALRLLKGASRLRGDDGQKMTPFETLNKSSNRFEALALPFP
ncbi:hypothetical protein [Dyella sp. C11]|uniref:hypothetical protein n=1 Tax=Dyella sp. C11 TaxID=2126991 RepID=UPI000D655CF4|nr:hypothetical protein [Dyella sp. C11]